MSDLKQITSALGDAITRAQQEDADAAYVAEMEQLLMALQKHAHFDAGRLELTIPDLGTLYARLQRWQKQS